MTHPVITPKQFLSPFLKGANPAFKNWQALRLKPARRYEDRLIPVKSTLFLYKTVTGMPGDIKDPQVLLEVPLKHEGKDYFYHYPIDLNYLFSPQWRLDNKASPFGFFRWAVEMDTAVRLGVIRDYKGCRIMESILSKASGKAKKLEGKECKYKSIQATRSKSLTLHTLLFHLEINGLLDTLKGNHNQIALAEEIGISHLSQLFSALSALKDPKTNKPWTEVLGYNYIDLPVKTVKELEKELRKGHSSYIGNHNQIALAEEIGISHLSQLFSALSALKDPDTGKSWTEVLGYNVINLPVKTVKALEIELKKKHSPYIGNHNQIALAEEIGISNLGHLFSALSALKDPDTGKSWTEVLGYNVIDLPVKTVKALEIESKKNHSAYLGNHNQIALADKIGISNLGQLFSALSALKDPDTGKSWTEVLGYNVIDLPVKTVKALEIELKKKHSAYLGNHNQIPLAEEIGISNLGHLFSALSALKDPDTGKSWTEVLGYSVIYLPVKTVKALEIELKKKHSAYLGNHNQIPLAEEIGISNLGQLFSALSALKDPNTGKSWTEVLGYNVINLPVKTVKNFFSDLVDFAEEASFPYYIIAKSLADKSPEEAEKRFRWIVETSKRVPA